MIQCCRGARCLRKEKERESQERVREGVAALSGSDRKRSICGSHAVSSKGPCRKARDLVRAVRGHGNIVWLTKGTCSTLLSLTSLTRAGLPRSHACGHLGEFQMIGMPCLSASRTLSPAIVCAASPLPLSLATSPCQTHPPPLPRAALPPSTAASSAPPAATTQPQASETPACQQIHRG